MTELEILIPAYNEEHRLAEVISAWASHLEYREFDAALRVIDNGSSDRTADIVDSYAKLGVPISVSGCSRRGKGAAVVQGMLSTRARYVGFTDADLATPADMVDVVLGQLRAGHDVVIGSRRCTGAEYRARQPLTRRIGGMGFRLLSRRHAGPVADTQCGFKFFQAEAAHRIFSQVRLRGFAFDLEVIARAHALSLSVVEIPVAWTDQEGSSFRPLSDGRRVARELLRLHRTVAPPARDGIRHVVAQVPDGDQ